MSNGTKTAWQARAAERRDQFDQIKRAIDHEADDSPDSSYIYGMLLILAKDRLHSSERFKETCACMGGTAYLKSKGLIRLLCQADLYIGRFTPVENASLWAKLLVWAAERVASPYHEHLSSAELSNPTEIFGTARMDEVPIPG